MSESSLPPANLPTSSEASSQESLQKGLNALQRKDYTTAIRVLAELPRNLDASRSVRVKAQIALIRAYRGKGQTAEAIALCQPLTRHPQTNIQEWAQKTLKKLKAHHSSTPTPEQLASDTSGFQPLELPRSDADDTFSGLAESAPEAVDKTAPDRTAASASGAIPETTRQTDDRSGFRPLNAPEDIAALSGLVPLTSETASLPADIADTAATTDDAEPAAADSFERSPTTELTIESAAATNIADESAEVPQQPSLFHYEQLNNLASSAEQLSAETVSSTSPTTATAEEDLNSESTPTDVASEPWQFQYAGRLERPRSLPPSKGSLLKIWGIQIVTVIAWFWVLRAFVQGTVLLAARGLESIRWLVNVSTHWQYRTFTVPVIVSLCVLFFASPWLLDWVLKRAYRQKSLSINTLKQTHPEAGRLLGRIVQQRSWLFPTLKELPTDAPLIFSYGWLPRYGRIVISRGLLKRLTDEEFATLMGYELTHFTTWTAPVMSMMGGLLLLLHQSYWQTARWGDRRRSRFLKTLGAVISVLSYTLYWVFRKVSIPLSRVRVHECDRQAIEWTGNPNALVRALIKLEDGFAATVSVAGQTPPLVESTDLLTPSGYDAAISRGSLYPDPAFLKALQWDVQNPYRHWLAFNSSHPLLGERLKRLTGYARQWQLPPELPPQDKVAAVTLQSKVTFQNYWFPFLQQISPYISPIIGIAIAMVLWFVGGVARPLGIWQVSWVYGDQSLLRGGVLLGVGIGIMLRINRYFPDIIPASRLTHPALPDLLANSMALPTDSRTARLQGTLLGRRGIANWLCQDLILKTPTGLLKLHFLSSLGAVGNAFIHPKHPTDYVGRSLEVQGWFRRGAIAWFDIDQILRSGKVVARSNHPVLAVVLSLVFCALGLYTLLRG